LSLIALQPDGGAKADLALGTEEDMESENRDDRGGREGRRKKPRESQEGLITAHDPPETPSRKSDRYEQGDNGCDLGHSGMLSGSLEQRIVKI
jgi:hypothetical protein